MIRLQQKGFLFNLFYRYHRIDQLYISIMKLYEFFDMVGKAVQHNCSSEDNKNCGIFW